MNEQRIVYLCPTLLHLMNCIVTQMTVNRGIPADIVFQNITDFSEISKKLMKHSVFENCYHWKVLDEMMQYKKFSEKQKKEIEHHPSDLFSVPQFAKRYTDLCINADSFAAKFFYYSLLEQGMRPAVHFVSEGTGTYALDFANTARDKMDHDFYGEKAFLKNVRNIYLYRPELYAGNAPFLNLVQLPDYSKLPSEVHEIIEDVFGKAEPVEEKLIFFEGVFHGDGYLTNEMDLFLAIADHIGKENIIVKRHPRNTTDRFTPLGFKVMSKQNIPWEVMIKDLDFTHKALVSVASFTCFSAMEMYGKTSYSILLEDALEGRVGFLEDDGYKCFFRKAEDYFNSQKIVSWRPSSRRELELVLDVVGEKIGGWNR